MSMYSAAVIANYFLQKAKACGELLTPMKLMKLVYFSHGWYLGITGKSLVSEPIFAWQYGPVINSLYHQFKKFGNEPITELAPHKENCFFDDATRALLDRIWDVYGRYTAFQLSNLSHEKGSPWDKAWHEEKGHLASNYTIRDELIHEFYANKLNRQNKQ